MLAEGVPTERPELTRPTSTRPLPSSLCAPLPLARLLLAPLPPPFGPPASLPPPPEQMRLVKEGGRGYDVTDGVAKVAKQFECTPVEGQLSCNVRPSPSPSLYLSSHPTC